MANVMMSTSFTAGKPRVIRDRSALLPCWIVRVSGLTYRYRTWREALDAALGFRIFVGDPSMFAPRPSEKPLYWRPQVWSDDPTAGCPCRPENGGSGICGCVLSGPRITC